MKCPKCGNEYDGKRCEHCWYSPASKASPPIYNLPKPPEKMKSRTKRLIIFGGVCLAFILIAAIDLFTEDHSRDDSMVAAESSPTQDRSFFVEATSNSENEESVILEESSEVEERNYYIAGESFDLKDYRISVIGYERSDGSDYAVPDKGYEYVYLELEIKNISDDEKHISSVWMFSAYCDDYVIDEDFGAEVATDKESLSATLAPGKKVRGVLSYQLPEDWTELEVIIDAASLFSLKNIKATIKAFNN